ncbi:hypothetical protein ANAPH1_01013 [Anaplasma phagocytophilum]|nr:hypothetical protein ANAPH2_01341 [Anaplasma phagocytophilum]SCV66305.1 hypothetical protein ANAPH1_01013 [Anaplasma phagocytophilum]
MLKRRITPVAPMRAKDVAVCMVGAFDTGTSRESVTKELIYKICYNV